MNIRALILGLGVAPFLVSCVQQGDLDRLNARMTRNEQQMQSLSSQVGNVEQVLPGQAEMWAQMQAMRQELNMARGQLDDMTAGAGAAAMAQSGSLEARVNRLENAVNQMAAQLGIKVEALDAPLAATAPIPGAAPQVAAPGDGTPVAPETTPGEQGDTATRLYDSGMNAFASRNYADAVKAFTDFGNTFPQHKLASNAHFWRGESYFQLKDYPRAALAYQDVIQKYPGSGKLQSAMLKQGMAMYQAGQKDAAKVRLNELVKKYPKSPEASRAKKFLQQNK